MRSSLLLLCFVSLGVAMSSVALHPEAALASTARKGKDKGRAKGNSASPAATQSAEAGADDNPAADSGSITDLPPWSMFEWQVGPTTGLLGDVARVQVPADFLFGDKQVAQKLMEVFQNPVTGDEQGVILPKRKDNHWLAIFEYSEDGHVNDDDKNEIDADAILESLRQGTEEANIERQKHGWAPVHVSGWARPPRYNDTTHNLEWAVTATAEDGLQSINYNTRLLSRTGVMSVTLLVTPENMSAGLPEYARVLGAFAFTDGNRYGDYRQGDKLAEYGLAALMVGGGAAIAAKTGLLLQLLLIFKKGWKVLIIALAAGAAALRRFFGRLGRKGDTPQGT
ncbi:MAG: DUF2167 domain-containing protein [Deltaproteobacteria bacterium]|nr:DUF2167 domain-containing protein [Deltaproteobacteria bacterium]